MDMKGIWTIMLLAISGNLAAQQATAESLIANMTKVHNEVFNPTTLLTKEITKEQHEKWMKAFYEIEDYIKTLLNKARSFGQGISSANRAVIEKAIKQIKEEYANILSWQRLFVTKPDFKVKNEAVVQKFNATVTGLASLQKELNPALLDVADTKSIKKVLANAAFLVQSTAKSLIEAFQKR